MIITLGVSALVALQASGGVYQQHSVKESGAYDYKGLKLETDSQGDVKLYRAVNETEYNSIKTTGQFSTSQGSMETKWMATSLADAQCWSNAMIFGNNCSEICIG